ncbi:AAA family ATPase [Pseudorhodoferax sp.]|uniref:AAA family ATPase n=1 Tax=Pseudorhodoferax sp. TaxID=1993553 RepID=UPI002DD677F0|nr:AAA family ATPase [Pseudorhodoferax sp.]
MQPPVASTGLQPPGTPCLRLLGPPHCLNLHSGTWQALSPKAAALLALLALQGPQARPRLMAWLWPDHAQDKARVNLRGLLRDLRRLAGRELFDGPEPLALAPDVGHDGHEDIGAELLAGLDTTGLDEFEAWLSATRSQRREAWLDRLRRQAGVLERSSRPAEAAALIEQGLRLAPLDEGLHRTRMRLHAQAGDRDAALRAYAHCRERLQQELGVEPDQATRALATLIELGEPLPAPAARWRMPWQPAHTVAREQEQQTIQATWAAGRHLLLEGEAGAGKTRLARSALGTHDGVVFVTALHGDDQLPFATLARLLRRLLADHPPTLDPGTAAELARLLPELGQPASAPAHLHTLTAALQQAWQAFGHAGLGGVVLDDLQWADDISTKLVLHLAEAATPHWALVQRAGARPLTLQAEPARWHRLQLAALAPPGVAALLGTLPLPVPQVDAWARWLCTRTLGNPLHLVEAVQALLHEHGPAVFTQPPVETDGPATPLAQLLQQRLRGLDDEERDLAHLMALAGPLFSLRLACAVLGAHELACGRVLARLQQQGIADGPSLAHDLLRAPLLHTLPAAAAQALHARIGALAEAASAPAALVADQWWRAQHWPQAAAAFERAAQAAFALNARADELRLWDQAAAAHARTLDAAALFRARLRGFDAALAVQAHAEVSLRAARLRASARTGPQAAEADLAQARCDMSATRWADARVAAEQAYTAAGGDDAPASHLRQRAALVLASSRAACGDVDQALHLLAHTQAEVRAGADLRLRMDHAATTGYVQHAAGRITEAETACRDALALALQLQDGAEVMTLATNLAVQQQLLGDFDAAYQSLMLSEHWAARIGEAGSLSGLITRLSSAASATRLGRLGEALKRMQALAAPVRAVGAERLQLVLGCQTAAVWMDLGQCTRAQDALDEAHTLPGAARSAQWQATQLALQRLVGGDDERALGVDPAALLSQCAHDRLPNRLLLELTLLPEYSAQQALQRCGGLRQQALAGGLVAALHSLALHEADAWRRHGEPAQAAARLQHALAGIGPRQPFAMNPARQGWMAWRIFSAAGQAQQAQAALQRAADWLLHTARPLTPAAWHDGLLHAHPLHRRLLQAAGVPAFIAPAQPAQRLPVAGGTP